MANFDSSLKAMASYKLEELIELCKKLDIYLPSENENICNNSISNNSISNNSISNNSISNFFKSKKKILKKDIYQLLVSNY
jgi:hypothetical protein